MNYAKVSHVCGAVESRLGSILDTKEISPHFWQSPTQQKTVKNTYKRSNSRYYNLQLADKLQAFYNNAKENGVADEYNRILTCIKSLRCCASACIVETKDNLSKVVQHSHTCKNSACAICSRERSAKYANRLNAALRDEKNKALFQDTSFYFLTLTLRHDLKGNRSKVYLSELKASTNKLFRSKLMEGLGVSGRVTCYESTFSETTGFHIHAHILIACDKLKGKVKMVEKSISDKWLKITKDSNIVKLKLLQPQIKEGGKCYLSAIKEVVKYSAKIGNVSNMNAAVTNLYVDWLQQTKGAHFFITSGVFYGLNLSQYDMKKGEKPDFIQGENATYQVARTKDLSFIRFTKKTGETELKASRYQDRKALNSTLNGVGRYNTNKGRLINQDNPLVAINGLLKDATSFDCTKVINYLINDFARLQQPFRIVYAMRATQGEFIKVHAGLDIQFRIKQYEKLVLDSVRYDTVLTSDNSVLEQLSLFAGVEGMDRLLADFNRQESIKNFISNF